MSAAVSTLDSTVQSVFLGALQAYYNAQAARAAVTAARESERASRESLSAAEVRYRSAPAPRPTACRRRPPGHRRRSPASGPRACSRNSLGRLANVMGLDANQPLRLDDIPAAARCGFEGDVAALIAEARERRPN
jgi:outer membrane protein